MLKWRKCTFWNAKEMTSFQFTLIIGLPFERPYLIKGLNRNQHFSLRFQQGNIYGQTKDHLPRKVTPVFVISINMPYLVHHVTRN